MMRRSRSPADAGGLPPRRLVAVPVKGTMVGAAERHRELIANHWLLAPVETQQTSLSRFSYFKSETLLRFSPVVLDNIPLVLARRDRQPADGDETAAAARALSGRSRKASSVSPGALDRCHTCRDGNTNVATSGAPSKAGLPSLTIMTPAWPPVPERKYCRSIHTCSRRLSI
jgi:hypothetical protein